MVGTVLHDADCYTGCTLALYMGVTRLLHGCYTKQKLLQKLFYSGLQAHVHQVTTYKDIKKNIYEAH